MSYIFRFTHSSHAIFFSHVSFLWNTAMYCICHIFKILSNFYCDLLHTIAVRNCLALSITSLCDDPVQFRLCKKRSSHHIIEKKSCILWAHHQSEILIDIISTRCFWLIARSQYKRMFSDEYDVNTLRLRTWAESRPKKLYRC